MHRRRQIMDKNLYTVPLFIMSNDNCEAQGQDKLRVNQCFIYLLQPKHTINIYIQIEQHLNWCTVFTTAQVQHLPQFYTK